MIGRPFFVCLVLCGFGLGAQAGDLPTALPTLALDPQPPPSIWSGFYVGTEMFAVALRGAKGTKGLVGGAVTAGYNHEFANNLIVGIDTATGYAPTWFRRGPFRGFDYGAADVRIGYDLGRLTPYVTTGLVLAKPNFSPHAGYFGGSDSFNNLFNSAGDLRGSGTVGAGFDYAVTNRLHMGLGISVGTGNALVVP
ncbi:MAG: hypothetical protein JO163_10220 [Methylobacteriaceae bacterium]|nr:hypothetical protein [Methylobacteriaceae bacterium]